MPDDQPKQLSLLQERTLELATIFHRKMLENLPNNPEAVSAAEDVTPGEMIESMRHCQYCDQPVWTVQQMRSLLIESDTVENASDALFQILADHMNQCEVGRSMGAPFVKPPVTPNVGMVTGVVTYVYWLFIIVYGLCLLLAGVIALGKVNTFWIIVTILWFIATVDRVWVRINAHKKS